MYKVLGFLGLSYNIYSLFVFNLVPTSTFKPTPEIPAFQFVGSIDRNGSAEKASLKEGDYLIEVSFYKLFESYA